MSTSSTLPRALAAIGVAALALLGSGTGTGTAHAAYSDCPSTYNCFFLGWDGTDRRTQFAGNNSDLTWQNIQAMSGYNRGTSGMRACGYRSPSYHDLNYSRPQGDRLSFSIRPIRSMKWGWTCPNS